jgi:hypothetical protein
MLVETVRCRYFIEEGESTMRTNVPKFLHQVHCGTPHGKSLIDYVVPEKNKGKCFLIRKPINFYEIKRELKKQKEVNI